MQTSREWKSTSWKSVTFRMCVALMYFLPLKALMVPMTLTASPELLQGDRH